MVIHELTRHRVVTIALGLRAQGANHLAVAGIAALADIDVTAL